MSRLDKSSAGRLLVVRHVSKAIAFVLFPRAERQSMSDRTTKHKVKEPEMRAEYDFAAGVRGKYYDRYIESSNVVVLEPDVHKRFKNAKAVNEALRSLIHGKVVRRNPAKRPDTGRARWHAAITADARCRQR